MTASAERRARRGISAPEFLVIFLMFAVGVITLFGMFQATSSEAFKSKWAYIAAQVAREELETVRTLNLFGRRGTAPYEGHGWERLEGSLFRRMGGTLSNTSEEAFTYPEEYRRIETKLDVDRSAGDRFVLLKLSVRYEQKGSSQYGFQAPGGQMKPIGVYDTIVVDRWIK